MSILILLSVLSAFSAQGQGFNLKIIPVDSGQVQKKHFNKRLKAWNFLREKQILLQQQGYLACSVDSFTQSDSVLKVWFFTGQRYRWAKIDFSELPVAIWNNLAIRKTDWQNVPLNPEKLAALYNQVLQYCDNNGYPFAATFIDHFHYDNNGFSAKFHLKKGSLERIDTIIVEGNTTISLSYLENYLNIHQGSLYNAKALRRIDKRLNELPFLQEKQPWDLRFTIGKNKLYLYLERKNANQINGLLGLQPQTEATGKFMLTADFLLGLHNSLGYGETIEATYKNLTPKSPRFHAHVIAPYILGSPFGLEGGFDLYKQDTTYRKVTFQIGIRYQFSAENYVKVFYKNISNRLITVDTHSVRIHKQLPKNIDVKSNGIGVTLATNRTDYKLNPRRGWLGYITATGLRRKIIPNNAILEMGNYSSFDYHQLFDQANTHKFQYQIEAQAGVYFPVYKSIIGNIQYQGGYVYSYNIFKNELFQIGGFKSLRGFDENAFYANQYHILSLEIHFEFGQNSYFYVFNDDAFVDTRLQNIDRKDYPISFGLGLSLQNKTGIFNIALGIGKHHGERFSFRDAKIHFGYAAYF